MSNICSCCNNEIPPSKYQFTTGYGIDREGNKVCYTCCGDNDRKRMVEDGAITLYLTNREKDGVKRPRVVNWPGSLEFNVYLHKEGRHNIAGKRRDVWFRGPDNHVWHGVQYGDMTEICHCKRTKEVLPENSWHGK